MSKGVRDHEHDKFTDDSRVKTISRLDVGGEEVGSTEVPLIISDKDMYEVLQHILVELHRMNTYLFSITGERVTDEDIQGD